MSLEEISDDALPGLRIVADQKLFLPALMRALSEAGRNHGPIASMRVVRVRHRKGERAVIHAEFDGHSADEKVLPASIWLRSEETAARRGRKAAAGQAKGAPVYEPLSGALVYFFPSDPYVPEIAEFVSNPQRHSASLLEGLTAPAGILELARFRPGIGATFRWGAPGAQGAYVKIQKDYDAQSALGVLKAMSAASSEKSFTIPRPLGIAAEINAIAMEEVHGDTLAQRLASASPSDARTAISNVLRALKDLHQCGYVPLLRRDRTYYISNARTVASRIANIEPGTGERATALADRLAGCDVRLAEQPAHCDIKLEHIVFCEQRITFIDLDSVALSDPLFDVAMLDLRAALAAGVGLIGQHVASMVRKAARRAALVDYGTDAESRYAWLRACAALRLASHFAQNTGPHSFKLCQVALKIGEKSLSGVARTAEAPVSHEKANGPLGNWVTA